MYEDIDNATRMKLRNEHLERQFKKNQSGSEQKPAIKNQVLFLAGFYIV